MGVPWQDVLCSSIPAEIACGKRVFHEICLPNKVANPREVTLLGKVPIFGKVVLAMLALLGEHLVCGPGAPLW